MSITPELPPLSLYIHIPWCERKCPYCDFNSHENFQQDLEPLYINKLIQDFETELPHVQNRVLQSIFIGGGTPSMFSPDSIKTLLLAIRERIQFSPNIEITLEANPASSQSNYFERLSSTLVNRVSLGVQSFNKGKLEFLGRLHSSEQALSSIAYIKRHFSNFNIDLMFGLKSQNQMQALDDLKQALTFSPPHLSWYQLTIEKNTVFYNRPPLLPDEDSCFELHQAGIHLLENSNYDHYEISAFAIEGKQSIHNLNYWNFGDYLGIGAGAHGKITQLIDGLPVVKRTQKSRLPKDYLERNELTSKHTVLSGNDLALEFLMNALRLKQAVNFELFEKRTGLNPSVLNPFLEDAVKKGLLIVDNHSFFKTVLGENHLDSLLALY